VLRTLAFATLLALALPAYGQDLQKGLDAYNNGDYATALRELRPLAEQGYAKAQFRLGWMYYNGKGVAQDDAEAVRWYRLAAAQGLAGAQNNLGIMYKNGRGVAQDYVQVHLGLMYEKVWGVAQDDAEAVRLYRLAAEQGYAGAQNNLGRMYYSGKGVAQDYVLAHNWWNLAAAQGNENAVQGRNIVADRLTPAAVVEAQRMAREWLEAHQ
jgi:hypothetical protein